MGGSERLSCHGVGMAPASVPFRNIQSFETSHTKRYHAAVTEILSPGNHLTDPVKAAALPAHTVRGAGGAGAQPLQQHGSAV